MTAAIFQPDYFQDRIFHDKADLFYKRHGFLKVIHNSLCIRAILGTHLYIPLGSL
jgi:hypothetical protein